MSLISRFIRTDPSDIMQRIDDACDYRSMTRDEALKFLEHIELEIAVRIDLVSAEIQRCKNQSGFDT
jgi:hypothetical protein